MHYFEKGQKVVAIRQTTLLQLWSAYVVTDVVAGGFLDVVPFKAESAVPFRVEARDFTHLGSFV